MLYSAQYAMLATNNTIYTSLRWLMLPGLKYDNYEIEKKVVPCSMFIMSFYDGTQIYGSHRHAL